VHLQASVKETRRQGCKFEEDIGTEEQGKYNVEVHVRTDKGPGLPRCGMQFSTHPSVGTLFPLYESLLAWVSHSRTMLFSLNKMVNRLSPAAILGKGKESYLTQAGVGAENRNTTELRTSNRNCKKAGVKWIAMYVRTMSEVNGDFCC
jgi:hypothetical protein